MPFSIMPAAVSSLMAGWNFDDARGRNIPRLRIGADGAVAIGDTVPHLEACHALPHFLNNAHGLLAETGRQFHGIEAGAMVGINVIQADGRLLNADFAGFRLAKVHVHQLHDFRPACLLNSNSFCHAFPAFLEVFFIGLLMPQIA